MKKLYLSLTILGAIVPSIFYYQFMQVEGLNISVFISSIFANGAVSGFSADLFLSSLIFWIFMFQQLRKPNNPKPYLFIALNLIIGLSCALPAYLYAREKT